MLGFGKEGGLFWRFYTVLAEYSHQCPSDGQLLTCIYGILGLQYSALQGYFLKSNRSIAYAFPLWPDFSTGHKRMPETLLESWKMSPQRISTRMCSQWHLSIVPSSVNLNKRLPIHNYISLETLLKVNICWITRQSCFIEDLQGVLVSLGHLPWLRGF